jgi:hypothetical protein
MNKQKLLEKAELLLSDRRHYDGKNWHAVNVKRYNDSINIDSIKIDSDYKDSVMEAINSTEEYYFWLESEWQQLNYELSDLHNIFNKGDEWYHDKFQFVTLPVYSLGRSGGWACFESELERISDEVDSGSSIADGIDDLSACIEEVEFVISFIENYNKNISYQDYVENNIECIIERVERSHQETIKKHILPLTLSKNEQIKRHAKGIIKEFEKLSL